MVLKWFFAGVVAGLVGLLLYVAVFAWKYFDVIGMDGAIARSDVHSALMQGSLEIDEEGVVVLDGEARRGSWDGKAYFSILPQGRVLLFPTWLGLGRVNEGYLYVDGGLERLSGELEIIVPLSEGSGLGMARIVEELLPSILYRVEFGHSE